MRRFCTVASLLPANWLFVLAGVASGQAGDRVAPARAETGVIVGTVTDSSLHPLSDADVSIVLSRIHVTANGQGRFRIVSVPPGDYLLVIRRLGFHAIAAGVTVQSGDTVRPAFLLEPSIPELAAVTVSEHGASPRLREFEERRQHGGGSFFNQQEIEAHNAASAVDILREAKGLSIMTSGPKQFALSARQWATCPMQVYVDGIPMAAERPGLPFDLNFLPSPKEILGIEVYSGPESEPLWLPTGPQGAKRGCGAVLVWTRDGS